MSFAICQVSVAPVRSANTDMAEMVTQLLFGEKVVILEREKKWVKIKADFDGYEGFVDPKQLFELSENEYQQLNMNFYTTDAFNLAVENDLPLTLPLGAVLPNYNQNTFGFGGKEFQYLGEVIQAVKVKKLLIDFAILYLNVPYLWGGKSTFGIDCSGLVQQVYKLCGYKLPRDASQQAEVGEVLSFLEETEPGDLAFFDNQDGKIIHVGIVLEYGKIIHAHGKVRIDPLDTNGIFNTDSQEYSHKLRFLKRIIPN